MRYRPYRNYGCRITDELIYKGYQALILENESIRMTILLDKGTDVVELLYKPDDIDITWRTEQGLRPPQNIPSTAPTPLGSFIDLYEGGWQEVFPNGGGPIVYKGAELGQHGEIAQLPWDYEILDDYADYVRVKVSVKTIKTPFEVEKIYSLRSGESKVNVNEKIANTSDERLHAMWGQHLAFGPPFLTSDCFIEIDQGVDVIPHSTALYPNGRRIDPNQTYKWPLAKDLNANLVDLSLLPPRGTPSEMLYLHGFKTGKYSIINPNKSMRVQVTWDETTFPYLWFWQEFGKGTGYPWYKRHYNIGLEPFSSFPTNGLLESIENGTALPFAPGETKSSWYTVQVEKQT